MNGITALTRDNHGYTWVRTFMDNYRCIETNENRYIGELAEANGHPMEIEYI